MNSMHNYQEIVQPFTYPIYIKIFLFFVFWSAFITVPYSLYKELPYHYEVSKKVKIANKLFKEKDYFNAIRAYMDLSEKFKNYKEARIKSAQACFALTKEYDALSYEIDPEIDYENLANHMFYIGINCLADLEYRNEEIEDLKKYISESRMDDFNSIFKQNNNHK